MEEEDSILGLAPPRLSPQTHGASLMPTDDGHGVSTNDIATVTATNVSDWSFENALHASSAAAAASIAVGEEGSAEKSSDDDDDADSGEGEASHNGEEVPFRENGMSSGAGGTGRSSAEGSGDWSDEALQEISDKKMAKRLGKKLYKRWKKLRKSSKHHKHKSSKKEKSREKKKGKKEKKSGKSSKDVGAGGRDRKKKKHSHEESDDDGGDILLQMGHGGAEEDAELGLIPEGELSNAAAVAQERLKKAALRELKMRAEKTTKKAGQSKMNSAEVTAIAKELVSAMAKARQLDGAIVYGGDAHPGQFPLHRVSLKGLVEARCRQGYMVGALVEAGILQELSYWLYDVEHADPAPYELRTTALDILLSLPMEDTTPMKEDLTAFAGVSREHLIKTDLGRALNALRRYNDETVDNKGKCVQLLTTFSRVISGMADKEQADENQTKAVWKCQRDPTVASPFAVLETCSEAFQKAFMKPDPRDPTSYNGILPWRPPAATVTNISGDLGNFAKRPRKVSL